MAFADLREELTCSICLSIYTDPVTLTCGHSYCQVCIGNVLDTQEGSGAYRCPECRVEFQERPALEKNRKLCNIAESFLSNHPEQQEEARILCTYCIQSPVSAAKTCLLCEASLCAEHLKRHSKSEEHVLSQPTTYFGSRKCPIHKKILEYYCSEDAVCICVSCCLIGYHKGHQMESLHEASERKKKKLKNVLDKLTSKREEAEKSVLSLQKHKREVQVEAAGVTERVTALIRDIKEQLETLEKHIHVEISRQEKQVSLRVSDLIRQLEIKKEELSGKMDHIEELYNMTDPITVLQGQESDCTDISDVEAEDKDTEDRKVHAVGDLDVDLITQTLHTGLDYIVSGVKKRHHVLEALDILLDVNTAHRRVTVSDDLMTASYSEMPCSYSRAPERFLKHAQVLNTRSFSSGRHYWEVECSDLGQWCVGVTYPSIEREGDQSWIGGNNKSWGLWKFESGSYSVRHDNKIISLRDIPTCLRFGIYLDYGAGQISFYELCDPIRHLHTFTATFTEPLHAGFNVTNKAWVKIRSQD
ncbi:E3 ubiquitin ISG15 ligase TRIM25-like [Pelobates cultripes]|uniref:E3 ubiquitin ISG15 ligase TRIM25-like n=1 Tax=Pelobates cultripes TaxID=61616 RepID=A0AAD1WS40_PELCU|nr:E3 ubiquitin ISG15 ligase TRIM25-like [Pelobates cultripes]